MLRRIVRSLGGGIAFLAVTAVGAALSMGAAYWLVQERLKGDGGPDGPTQLTVHRGELLREYSNALLALADRYALEAPAPPDMAARAWIERQFLPELHQVRLRMADTPIDLGPRAHELWSAADRLAAMAAQPENAELRRRAFEDLLRASARAEAHLRETGASRFIGTPPYRPRFDPGS